MAESKGFLIRQIWVGSLAPQLAVCARLGKSLDFSEAQFLPLNNEDNSDTYSSPSASHAIQKCYPIFFLLVLNNG